MANTTRNIWNDDDGSRVAPRAAKGKHFLRFFLTLVVVLAVVVFAAYRDGTGFDALRRYLHYGTADDSGSEALYDYDAAASNRFALLGEQLVVLSETHLRVLNPDGGEVWSTTVNMSAPALQQGGGMAVAYDVGGTELYVVNSRGEVYSLRADAQEPLVAATLNSAGWLALTTEKRGVKSWVGVYDETGELVFAFHSSRRFVTDACVTDDCAALAAVTLGQESSVFVSNVVLYNLTEEEPTANYSVTDGLVAAIGQQNDCIVTVSDTALTFAGTDGTVQSTYWYRDSYLRDYALSGDGFAALLLNRYRSGSVGQLVSVGSDGAELGRLDVSEEVLSISAAGRYLAVLYGDSLVIYNPDLQVYATLKGTGFAKEALVRTDGSALLLSAEYAKLFLP